MRNSIASIDPFFSSTVLLLSGDIATTLTDESAAHRGNGALNGNADGGSSSRKFGAGAIGLDGATDWVQFADSNDFSFGSGDFTVECWFQHGTTESDHLISKWFVTGNNLEWALVINNTSVQFFWSTDGSTSSNLSTGPVTITAGTFYHVAFSRVGSTGYILFDGLIRATTSMSGVTIRNGTGTVRIGANDVGTGEFTGQCDEVRITNGVGRYSGTAGSAYTVPTAAFPRS